MNSNTFHSITNDAGKVNYTAVINLLANLNSEQFIQTYPNPFLILKEVDQSTLSTDIKNKIQDEPLTILFNVAEFRHPKLNNNLSSINEKSTIYYLQKTNHSYEPRKDLITIGRHESNDLVIKHGMISKRHAQIAIFFNHYSIIDLQSTNGIKIHQQRIVPNQQIDLYPLMEFELGQLNFIFVPSADFFTLLQK